MPVRSSRMIKSTLTHADELTIRLEEMVEIELVNESSLKITLEKKYTNTANEYTILCYIYNKKLVF